MALERKVIPIRLDTGVDLSADPHSGVGLTRCENARFERNGAVSKRYGKKRMVSGTDIFESVSVDVERASIESFSDKVMGRTDSGSVVLVSDDRYDYASGRCFTLESEFVKLGSYSKADPMVDVALANSNYCVAYKSFLDGALKIAVYDEETGALNSNSTVYASTPANIDVRNIRTVKAVANTGSDQICRFYYNSSSNSIGHGYVNLRSGASANVPAITNVGAIASITTSATTKWFDCAFFSYSVGAVCITYSDAADDLGIVILDRGNGAAAVLYAGTVAKTVGRTVIKSTCFSLGSTIGIAYVEWDAGTNTAHTRFLTKTGLGVDVIAPMDVGGEVLLNVADVISICGVYDEENDAYDVLVSYAEQTANYGDYVEWNTIDTGGGSVSTTMHYRRRVAVKPFRFYYTGSGVDTAVVFYSESYGNSNPVMCNYFLVNKSLGVDSNAGGLMGSLFPGRARTCFQAGFGTVATAVSTARGKSILSGVTIDPGTGDKIFGLVYVSKESAGDQDFFSFSVVRVNEIISRPSQSVYSNGHSYIGGLCPYEFDGATVSEHGFLQYPERITATIAAGGVLTSGAVYYYLSVYEYLGSNGKIHRSFPGTATSVTPSGGNLAVDVSLPSLTFTLRSSVNIAVYRTVGNGSVFYRLGHVSNNTAAQRVAFSDSTVTDAVLETREQLYTQSGQIGFLPPRPYYISALWNGRQFIADAEIGNTVRFSHVEIYGEPIQHAGEVFSISLPCADDITALHPFLDGLLIWTRKSLYMIEGSGPSPDGGGASFSTPFLISPSVGCINNRSIVRLPQGIAFQSEDGLWLIGSDMSISRFGDPVAHYFARQEARVDADLSGGNSTTNSRSQDISWRLTAWMTVTLGDTGDGCGGGVERLLTACSLNNIQWASPITQAMTTGQKIRWWDEVKGSGVMSSQHTAAWCFEMITIYYDYVYNKWSTRQCVPIFAAASVNDKLTVLEKHVSSNRLYRDDLNSYIWESPDESSSTRYDDYLPFVIETGWISASGLLGYQRVYELILSGYNLRDHVLVVKFSYDYKPTWIDTITFTMSDNSLGSMPDEFDYYNYFEDLEDSDAYASAFIFRAVPTLGKCTAIRAQITDYHSSSLPVNDALTITNAAFVVGTKPGRGALTTPGRYK